jgi:hypothetical protein
LLRAWRPDLSKDILNSEFKGVKSKVSFAWKFSVLVSSPAMGARCPIEIGDQEGFGFVARALDYGGLAFEDDRPDTLAEALAALEMGLRAWFKEQGIEVK